MTAPVTPTLNVHVEPTSTAAPERPIELPPLVVSVPPQTFELPSAIARPTGRLAATSMPVTPMALLAGLVTVKSRAVWAPTVIAAGWNAMAMDGGARTLRVATAELPATRSSELTGPVSFR